MKTIKKIRKPVTHVLGEHTTYFKNWKGETKTVNNTVFVDVPQNGNLNDYAHEGYIEQLVFDDMRGKWYHYHLPVEVHDHFYGKPSEVIFYEYIQTYDVPSYGRGIRDDKL